MWRLLFSKKKLDLQSKVDLAGVLEDISYSCGSSFDELDLPDNLKCVCVKHHECNDPIEKLYYSTGFEPICIHCASEVTDASALSSDYYPQCPQCMESETPVSRPIKRKK